MLQKETPAVAVRSLTERGEELRHRLQEEPSRAVSDDYHIARNITIFIQKVHTLRRFFLI